MDFYVPRFARCQKFATLMYLVVSTIDDDGMGKWQNGDDNIPKGTPAFQASWSAYGVFDLYGKAYIFVVGCTFVWAACGGGGGADSIAVSNQMERKNGI